VNPKPDVRPVVLVGSGDLGRDALTVHEAMVRAGTDITVAGFVDDNEAVWGSTVAGLPVLGGTAWLAERAGDYDALLTVGSPRVRRVLDGRLTSAGVRWTSWVHPSVEASPWVSWGEGALVMALSSFTIDVVLGRHVVVNPGCTIAHDVRIGDYAYLSPGVDLAGRVELETRAYMGTGAVVIPGCRVGEGAVVGAGAVVVRNVPPAVTVVGVPARPLEKTTP